MSLRGANRPHALAMGIHITVYMTITAIECHTLNEYDSSRAWNKPIGMK